MSALIFFRKSDLRIFEKTDKMDMLTEGTLPEIFILSGWSTEAQPFVAGMQRGGSSLLGLRGNAHYRVKGETHCPVI